MDNLWLIMNNLVGYLLKMTIEIVDFPIEHGGSFHSYVNVYQRVSWEKKPLQMASNFAQTCEKRSYLGGVAIIVLFLWVKVHQQHGKSMYKIV